MKQTYRLVHRQARERALDAVSTAPDGMVVTISEPTRNLEINAALHAKLTEISRSREWAGKSGTLTLGSAC